MSPTDMLRIPTLTILDRLGQESNRQECNRVCKMPEGCPASMLQWLSKKIDTKMQGIYLAKSFASRERRSAEDSGIEHRCYIGAATAER